MYDCGIYIIDTTFVYMPNFCILVQHLFDAVETQERTFVCRVGGVSLGTNSNYSIDKFGNAYLPSRFSKYLDKKYWT
jgi:hypothetical protein